MKVIKVKPKLFLLCSWEDRHQETEGNFLYGPFKTQYQRNKLKKELEFEAANCDEDFTVLFAQIDSYDKPAIRGNQMQPPFHEAFDISEDDEDYEE